MLMQLEATANEPVAYRACVNNERPGDDTVIDGVSGAVAATVRAGKRPRGFHNCFILPRRRAEARMIFLGWPTTKRPAS